jgi:sterol desaturase/sphingolipid hydroxylase (fatty acid hydroxylase superfamily)
MDFWLSVPARIAYLAILLVLLSSIEFFVPLYRFTIRRWRHAVPNIILTALVIVVSLCLAFLTVATIGWAQEHGIGLLNWLDLPPAWALLIGVVGLDLFAYFAHVAMHMSDLGWRLHQVHHSDAYVDATTALRQHPGETLIRIGFQIAGVVAFGTPVWVVVIYLTISSLNAQLEHANVKIPEKLDRWLQWVWVTPNMHKAHHSRDKRETNSNYSNIFSFWDRLFGTYTAQVDWQALRYGLHGADDPGEQSLAGLLAAPFSGTDEDKNREPQMTQMTQI